MERREVELPDYAKHVFWILSIFILYSIALFTLPFGAFFMTQYVLRDHYQVTGFTNTVWSVTSAITVMYIIILTYAFRGYNEKDYDEDGNEIVESVTDTGDKKD